MKISLAISPYKLGDKYGIQYIFSYVVKDENGKYKPVDRVSIEDEASDKNELKTVFEDGKLVKEFTLAEIRKTRQDAVHKLLDGTID